MELGNLEIIHTKQTFPLPTVGLLKKNFQQLENTKLALQSNGGNLIS